MSFSDRKIQFILLKQLKHFNYLGAIMDNNVENSQIEEFIANLKGRKAYEEKKAIKLGFSNFEKYEKFDMIKHHLDALFSSYTIQ